MAARQPQQQQQGVDPNVDTPRDSGEVTTMDGLFAGNATVVDEVVENPLASDEPEGGWWIIRPKEDIEHMSVGTIQDSYAFKAGVRYKVPYEVVDILAHRDYLSERPYPANA
jgi:hypothetical protein